MILFFSCLPKVFVLTNTFAHQMFSSLMNAKAERTEEITMPILFLHYICRQGSVVKDQTGEKSAFGLSKGLPNIYNWEKV
jgi:hypothetical protein